MAREIDVISTRFGWHHIEIGLDAEDLCGFGIQLWITRYGMRMVDWVQAMGLNWISFLGGDLWIHNDTTVDRCNLFGEKRDCIVGVVSNEQPMMIKILDSLGVWSDSQWEVTSIVIPPTLNYPNGMESAIPTAQFKKRGGVWRAKFLRNMKSTSDTSSVIEAIQGEPLTGQEAYMLLKNTSNEQVKLFKIQVNATTARGQ